MKKNNKVFYIYGGVVFVGLLLFFTFINPLTILDIDDWLYIHHLRKPVPMIKAWNPGRVFPETFMPLVSYFGAIVINPIIKDYLDSLSFAHGLFGSFILTAYFVQFTIFIYKRRYASDLASIGYGCLFILLHFISQIFRGHDNYFLIGAVNLTCFYYYTLSAAINATLVLHFMSYGGIKTWVKESSILDKAIVTVWAYFALFSNLFSSVVLAAYIGSELLLDLICEIKGRTFRFDNYCKSHAVSLVIIISWFVANVIELFGGRAEDIHGDTLSNLPMTFAYGIIGLIALNAFVFILEVVVFVSWFKRNRGKTGLYLRFFICFGCQIIYLILLSAASAPMYIIRSEVMIDNFFYIFTALILCLSQLIGENKKYKNYLLILLGTGLLLLIQPGRILNSYNSINVPYENSKALVNDLIYQFKESSSQGLNEMVLVLPEYDNDHVWPFSDLMGERVATALYKHKIIDHYIEVKDVIYSKEKNEQCGIPLEGIDP